MYGIALHAPLKSVCNALQVTGGGGDGVASHHTDLNGWNA
jgi:hypothetical protein